LGYEIPTEVMDKGIEYIISTPKALVAIFFSALSGHLWIYIISAYFVKEQKNKEKLDSLTGKIAVGLIWFSFIMLPVYLITHGTFNIEYEKLLHSVFSTILYGLFIQAIIVGLITIFKGENNE